MNQAINVQKENAELSYYAATQGMVLLKNDGSLPIGKKQRTALFGIGAVRTYRGGSGSGDPFNGGLSGGGPADVDQSERYHIHILDAFEQNGYVVPTASFLRAEAVKYDAAKNSSPDLVMRAFVWPEIPVTEEMLQESRHCDTAVYVISRSSGEGHDRYLYADNDQMIGDYLLSATEILNLQLLRGSFRKLIVVLNTGGIIDTKEIRRVNPNAILLMGLAGQEGGRAVVDVLNGTVTPSGKLTDTWAENYEDYPASASFATHDKDSDREEYREGLFVGYRHFDAKKIKAAYPFGFGLSYTTFSIKNSSFSLQNQNAVMEADIVNNGTTDGREVLQVYVSVFPGQNSAVGHMFSMPVKSLVGFAKTKLLEPGQEEHVRIEVSVSELASYVEHLSSWVLLAGKYLFQTGFSSDKLYPVASMLVERDQIISEVSHILPVDYNWKETEHFNIFSENKCVPEYVLQYDFTTKKRSDGNDEVLTYTTEREYQTQLSYDKAVVMPVKKVSFDDVLAGREELTVLLAQMSDEELISINCGTGWGVTDENNPVVGNNSQSVPGAAGETIGSLKGKYGLPSIVLADGPGGVRVKQEFEAKDLNTGKKVKVDHHTTAWPVGTQLAQSFDRKLLYEVGQGFARDMKQVGVDVLLGPGMNLHRDPLCGRNFEYYSEDPFLSGMLGAFFIEGIQDKTGVGGCIKHFAANNQETNRSFVDELISERTLREIYLKAFEIAVRKSHPLCMMTAYNKINHEPCGHSRDLCMCVARKEWDFDGFIMTDWNGGSSVASKSMHAGNDLIMPGGASKRKEILLALQKREPNFDERGQVLMTKPMEIMPFYESEWNSFKVMKNGKSTVRACLSSHHKAEVRGNLFFTDGEPIYLEASSRLDFLQTQGKCPLFHSQVSTEVAELSEDGKSIVYHGEWNDKPSITRGDLQSCAGHIIQAIIRLKKQ